MKRVIAFALSLLMVLSVVIIPASADPATVDSATENPTSADSATPETPITEPEEADNITPKPSNIGSANDITLTNDAEPATIIGQGICGDNLTWELDNGGTLTISGTGNMFDFSSFHAPWYSNRSLIKRVVIEKGVTNIGYYAFNNCLEMTSIVIPDSVTRIDGVSFYGCTGLTDIVIPDRVKSIRGSAFYGCTGLTSITIPDSVGIIEVDAFKNCTGLTSIKMGNGVTELGWTVFDNCPIETAIIPAIACSRVKNNSLKTVCVTSGTYIEQNSFYECTGLKSVELSDSVTSISSYAFYGCTGLTSIVLSENIESIGNYAFEECTSLEDIVIPENVKSIGNAAFRNCKGITSIAIPNGMTSIDNSTFQGCSGLTSIEIPNSVTSIGKSAFDRCTGLTSITIPNSVTSIGDFAFDCCSRLVEVYNKSNLNITKRSLENGRVGRYALNIYTPNSGESKIIETNDGYVFCSDDGKYYLVNFTGGEQILFLPEKIDNNIYDINRDAFNNCTGITSIVIPDGVTSIGDSAFSGCTGLTIIEIPDSVTSIGSFAFTQCRALANIYYYGTAEQWSAIAKGGKWDDYTGNYQVVFPTEGLQYALNSDNSSYSVTGIGTATDADIVIPPTYNYLPVTSIGGFAFNGCSGLTSIVIPNRVTNIDSNAFYYCQGLTSIEIPDSVTSIGEMAFDNCKRLTSIVIPNSVTSIGYFAFNNCSGLTGVYITDIAAWCNIKFVGALANPLNEAHNLYLNGTLVTDLVIPNGVTSIGDNAFTDCTGFTSVTIPDSVTSVGKWAFYNCEGLTSITIGKGVTSINDSAFTGCTNLTTIIGYTHTEDYVSVAQNFAESNGYEFKCLDIACKGYQVSDGLEKGENFNIRFAGGIDSLDYQKIGFEVVAVGFDKNWESDDDTVYKALTGTTKDGTPITAVTAEQLNCEYISAIAIKGVPANTAITFVLNPFVINCLGQKVYGEAWSVNISAEGVITYAKQ